MTTLRTQALAVLLEPDPWRKAARALALSDDLPVGPDEPIPAPAGIPGRPARPELVAHTSIRQRSIRAPA